MTKQDFVARWQNRLAGLALFGMASDSRLDDAAGGAGAEPNRGPAPVLHSPPMTKLTPTRPGFRMKSWRGPTGFVGPRRRV
jgi:hypothetical protein